jgi:hypothetical protein
MFLHDGQNAHEGYAKIVRRASSSQAADVVNFYKSEVSSTPSRLDVEGHIAIVTTREAGMQWTLWCRAIDSCGRTAPVADVKSCGPDLPTLRPSSLRLTAPRATGAIKPGSPKSPPPIVYRLSFCEPGSSTPSFHFALLSSNARCALFDVEGVISRTTRAPQRGPGTRTHVLKGCLTLESEIGVQLFWPRLLCLALTTRGRRGALTRTA